MIRWRLEPADTSTAGIPRRLEVLCWSLEPEHHLAGGATPSWAGAAGASIPGVRSAAAAVAAARHPAAAAGAWPRAAGVAGGPAGRWRRCRRPRCGCRGGAGRRGWPARGAPRGAHAELAQPTGRLELVQRRHHPRPVVGGGRAPGGLEVGQHAEVAQRPVGAAATCAARGPRGADAGLLDLGVRLRGEVVRRSLGAFEEAHRGLLAVGVLSRRNPRTVVRVAHSVCVSADIARRTRRSEGGDDG